MINSNNDCIMAWCQRKGAKSAPMQERKTKVTQLIYDQVSTLTRRLLSTR